HVLWPHNGQVLIDPMAGREDDPLSIYLMTLRPMHHFPVHSITTWMGTGEIVLTARDCAFVKDRPFTRAFLLEWEDFHEEGPFLIALVHPEMPPLSLRVSSLHLVSLTRRQQAAQDRIFLIDILFQGLPRRTAVRVSVGDTVREVVRRLDLLHLCGPTRYRCVLTQYEGSKEWNLFDIIEEPHATSFKLLFRNHGREALCQRSVPEAQPADLTSLMQGAANPPTPLTLYLRGWSHAKGAATFWVHCRADVMVQQYSAICSFDWPSLADEQCESLWQHCRPWQELNVVPVDPPPVFLVLPRPHVLIIGSPIGGDLPILCQVHERGRHNLVSVLVPYRSPDIAVATLFHLAIPQHDCEFGSQCYVVHDDERFLYRHELRLHQGAFLKLYEVARTESDYDPTCSGDSEDNQLSDALSVTSDPDSGLGTASELGPISDSLIFEDFASLMQRHSLGADVATHQVVFPRAVLQEEGGFPPWLQRELRSLWRGQARIFPLQSAPYVDLRIAVLLQAAFGHELPVLLEIHEQQDTWREIHVVTQAVTVNSLIWRSRLPPIVPETQHYQVALSGEQADPGDLIPWVPGQWLSVIVGPLGQFNGEGTTVSSLGPSLPSLSTFVASQVASSSLEMHGADPLDDAIQDTAGRPRSPDIGESDYPRVTEDDASFLFQAQVRSRSSQWIRGPRSWLDREEPLQSERSRFLEWRRQIDFTRRTTDFYSFEYFSNEAVAIWTAREQWPDFVIYSTKDERITHWGLAVDQFFVLERYEFTTIVRDYLRSAIPFHVKAVLIPVKPWPGLHEQYGDDDLFLLVDEDPLQDAIPVMISLWIRDGDRAPELTARRLPLRVTTLMLLQVSGVEEICAHQLYHCEVSHFAQELPRWMHWKPFPGMKIDITVDLLSPRQCDLSHMESGEDIVMVTDDISMMQSSSSSMRRVPRASDMDPMLPLRSVHTWHGSFLVPNPAKDQVRIGIRMTMPGSLEMLASFDFLCWGVVSATAMSVTLRKVLLREGRWDEQFQIAVSEMNIPQPTRLVLVAAQPIESPYKHMLAMTDDLFHSNPERTDDLRTHWISTDLQKLDDWNIGETEIFVFDFPIATLRLADCVLPCSATQKEVLTLADKINGCDIQMPDFEPLYQSLRRPWVNADIRWTPFVSQLSAELQTEAADLRLDPPLSVDSIEIFTDGSFSRASDDKMAGWSLLVLGYCASERHIIDYDWGLVQIDPMNPTWTGADCSNAKSAEG
ncbi:unnamed protein product, partial [Durusdinium trenchii]